MNKEVIIDIENPKDNDLISRQAVLDLPRIKSRNVWGEVIYESVDVEDVRQLPSVKPQDCETCEVGNPCL